MNTNAHKTTRRIARALCLLIAVAAAPASLRAATLTVTNTADSGAGTLRAALASAANDDSINFALPAPSKITLTNGELLISKSVAIIGPGASNLALDGNAASRVFHVRSNMVASLSNITITNGFASGNDGGGGIYNDHAMLTVSNSVVSGNLAGGAGGIYNDGNSGSAVLRLINSTVHGNSGNASYGSGGVHNEGSFGSATLIVSGCTISGNSATSLGTGGAIYSHNVYGTTSVQIVNTTLSGNSAFAGGGIYHYAYKSAGYNPAARLQILNSTLSGNSATASANSIYNEGGTIEIGGTILSDAGGQIANFSDSSISLGFNLSNDSGGGLLTNATDQINTDPLLGPLQDNGGPTLTHAPLPGSPAIDKGNNFSGSATDQRGLPRTLDIAGSPNAAGGDGTDIGAVELQDTSLRLVNVGVVSNQFGFNLIGPFTSVVVEASTSLTNWTPLATNALGDAALRFNDPSAPTLPKRFYRARVQ